MSFEYDLHVICGFIIIPHKSASLYYRIFQPKVGLFLFSFYEASMILYSFPVFNDLVK